MFTIFTATIVIALLLAHSQIVKLICSRSFEWRSFVQVVFSAFLSLLLAGSLVPI